MFGRGQRTDLDAEDGENLAERVRDEVARALGEEEEEEEVIDADGRRDRFMKGKL